MDKMTVETTVMKVSVEQVSQLKALITDVSPKIISHETVGHVSANDSTYITLYHSSDQGRLSGGD